jgi:spore coat polysaccharide biosynthesis protein SpsF (cytidylyltransferase family)
MSCLAIIQARTGSARLPGKVLMHLQGKPLLQHVIDRVRMTRGVDQVVVAAPLGDTIIETVSSVPVLYGDEDDVLHRYAVIAQSLPTYDRIMRVTGDCPLFAPDVAARVLRYHDDEPFDPIATNDTTRSGYPDGMDCEVFSAELLRKADREATDPSDREHVTPWMRKHHEHIVVTRTQDTAGDLKLSVDTLEDVRRVAAVLLASRGAYLSQPTIDAARRVRDGR